MALSYSYHIFIYCERNNALIELRLNTYYLAYNSVTNLGSITKDQVKTSIFQQVQLFRNCSNSLLRDLVLQLKPVTFLPGDLVVRKQDVGHHMYIIKSGECCVSVVVLFI